MNLKKFRVILNSKDPEEAVRIRNTAPVSRAEDLIDYNSADFLSNLVELVNLVVIPLLADWKTLF